MNSSGCPRPVSGRPLLHLSRSVPVHRDHSVDDGDCTTLRPPLSDSSYDLEGQTLASTMLYTFNGWCDSWEVLFSSARTRRVSAARARVWEFRAARMFLQSSCSKAGLVHSRLSEYAGGDCAFGIGDVV